MKEDKTKLHKAVELVNDAIMADYKRLEEITKSETNSPVMLEGETTKGYYCQLMIDPKDVARIMLQYDYPIYKTLEQEAPIAMWDDIASWYGLSSVMSVDI